jgi:hypothetical protein
MSLEPLDCEWRRLLQTLQSLTLADAVSRCILVTAQWADRKTQPCCLSMRLSAYSERAYGSVENRLVDANQLCQE